MIYVKQTIAAMLITVGWIAGIPSHSQTITTLILWVFQLCESLMKMLSMLVRVLVLTRIRYGNPDVCLVRHG